MALKQSTLMHGTGLFSDHFIVYSDFNVSVTLIPSSSYMTVYMQPEHFAFC